jgi:hypothetical protein
MIFKNLLLDYYFVITFEIPSKEKMNYSLKYFIKKIKTWITFFFYPNTKWKHILIHNIEIKFCYQNLIKQVYEPIKQGWLLLILLGTYELL